MKRERTHRFQIMLNDYELEAIDDWRYANKIPTRSRAARELCRIAIGRTGSTRRQDRSVANVAAVAATDALTRDGGVNVTYLQYLFEAVMLDERHRTQPLPPGTYGERLTAVVEEISRRNEYAEVTSEEELMESIEGLGIGKTMGTA